MDAPGNAVVRDITQTRRRTTATTVQRRPVIKKHLQQKYLLCGFAIHALLATPAYLYGIIVESDRELVMRIWPPIIYQAIGQICQSILMNSTKEYHGKPHETHEFRRIFLISTFITCSALTISGYLFSSAWVMVTTTTQIIAILVYGVLGAIGSSLFISNTHIIVEAVRPREDKYVRKTIHLCGEAFCQLFLSFVCTNLRSLYGISQSFVLMGALVINLIPLSLLITRHREGVIPKRISIITTERYEGIHHIGRVGSSITDQMDGIELQQRQWRNPTDPKEFHCNYLQVPTEESYVTYVNPHGVEIMEIIPEEDENISIMRSIRSSTITIDNFSRKSMDVSLRSLAQNISASDSTTKLERIQQFSKDVSSHLWTSMTEKVIFPMNRAVFIWKLYPATILQSTDIFSYVMCLIALPTLAVTGHALKYVEIPFLFTLLAFPWMCFSLMTPRFGGSLVKDKLRWHTLGCVLKALALIFLSISTSKLLLSVSTLLLGFGQAVSFFLQDVVIQNSMPKAQWIDVRYPLHLTNGLLVIVWGLFTHGIIVSFGFQISIGFAGGLYSLSLILWNIDFILFCKRKEPSV